MTTVTTVTDNTHYDIWAVTAPGLEAVCLAELHALGIPASADDGGVAWRGDARSLYRANLECRTASRITVRLGAFRARTFGELERHAPRLDWRRFLAAGSGVALRVTSRKSKLYHSGAVAERLAGVLAGLGVQVLEADAAADEEQPADAQLVVVRFIRDVCTISIDSSGALLHQRGYRQAVAKAPLRETLAAALLLAAGWRADTPLVDPFCGSGTIPIEAALLARRIPPGLASPAHKPRRFAFERWPAYEPAVWHDVVTAARAGIRAGAAVPIAAADQHGGAIAAARANAERAGVVGDVTFVRSALELMDTAAPAGHLVTNPPYGIRVGERRGLEALYNRLGRVARALPSGWTTAFLSADPRLEKATGLRLRELLSTRNGGIAVRLLAAGPGSAADRADGIGRTA